MAGDMTGEWWTHRGEDFPGIGCLMCVRDVLVLGSSMSLMSSDFEPELTLQKRMAWHGKFSEDVFPELSAH